MIGKAKAISHGVNDLRYITGESEHKKYPEKIFFVKNNLLDTSLNAMGIYDMMNFTCRSHPKMKNKVIRMELCPMKQYTKEFTIADWKQLWDDYIKEFDKIEIQDEKTGKLTSAKLNLANSMGTVWLHLESRSGVPHLHGAYCRVDEDGITNNDHDIHLRAQKAAENLALRRGWKTAKQLHDMRVIEMKNTCLEVLKSMNEWSWIHYANRLQAKGYNINVRKDNKGKIVSYSLSKGNSVYNASALKTRSLTAAHIEATWYRLHPQYNIENNTSNGYKPVGSPHPLTIVQDPMHDYTSFHEGFIPRMIPYEGDEHTFYLPKDVSDFFDNVFDLRTITNSSDLVNIAISVFVQPFLYLQTNDIEDSGGTSNDMPWRDKDEDELEWAHRCAMYAKVKLGVKPRIRYRR